MRIIGRLPDHRMQITVFENDGRFPVQFEQGGLSQMYRFRKGEHLSNMGHVRQYVDEAFRSGVLEQFEAMRKLHAQLLAKIEPPAGSGDELPVII